MAGKCQDVRIGQDKVRINFLYLTKVNVSDRINCGLKNIGVWLSLARALP